ncbi:hypothetical protein ACHAW5_003617 [Stephanodiscus triporus]|uniref:Nucleolar protein 16 n=1 Tax=Stephanodiscus triporus TaxID=2934178 RepID=A0ABD3MPM4_9STRA
MAMKIAKMQKIRAKSAKKNKENAKKGNRSNGFGSHVFSNTAEDNEYVIDYKVPSRKILSTWQRARKARASTIAKLKRNLRGVAGSADKVPDLQNNSLISTSKLADENYSTLFTPTEYWSYDGKVEVEQKRRLYGKDGGAKKRDYGGTH